MPSFVNIFTRGIPAKPKSFSYTPRYYDPKKEKLEALKNKYAENENTDQDLAASKARILSNFDRRRNNKKPKKKISTLKLALAIAFIILLIKFTLF